ncbi:CPBP family intramembrane glutamic endopeptidase [Brevundimonas sp. NIBR11]|uniref:CPBP family intramembrane glutamic endopeptidase n=1 Tax=Brevundimonas sp. NIBR11 TaxID=3015999 RepID=UPI0022F0BFD3|nr:CPBP family intramembrane glutamic endopeptidase [Brevundimonas sp. NIBR11]WGM30088.1 hypothetical protein KKHFBJBL_00303 [Brevundimonas sp. NIBR11]
MIATRLSQGFGLVLAGLLFLFFVISPGVVDPEFAGMIYAVLALVVGVLFAGLFFALRLATGGSTIFWSGTRPPTRQVRWIFAMIGTALAIQLSAGGILELGGWLNEETSTALALLVWTTVPATFLVSRRVEWPRRLKKASVRRLVLTGVVALGSAAAVSQLKFAAAPADYVLPSALPLLIGLCGILVMATAEEVVMRLLLLTALLDLTRSRFNALFLSSLVFALVHVPLEFAQTIIQMDWPYLLSSAVAYLPAFLMQMLMGLFLGVLWMRTGSISLIALTHAIANVGPALL